MAKLSVFRGPVLLVAGRWLLDQTRAGYSRLTERERSDLRRLLRKSRGRPRRNLTRRERTRLKKMVKKGWRDDKR